MQMNMISRIFGAFAFFLVITPAMAELPVGTFPLPVPPAYNISIYDVSGTFNQVIAIPNGTGATNMTLDFQMAVDNKGKITGIGTATIAETNYTLDATNTISGKISLVAGVTHVDFKIKMAGTGTTYSTPFSFTATFTMHTEIDPATLDMVGTCKQKMKMTVVGEGSESLSQVISYTLPPGGNVATWVPTILISDLGSLLGTTLYGTGDVLFTNARDLTFSLKGSYSAKKDESKVTCTGTAASVGSSIKVNFKFAGGAVTEVPKISGKILGQKFKAEAVVP